MPIETPPLPPGIEQPQPPKRQSDAPIKDVREQFARQTPQGPQDAARTRDFIAGKIEMIRSDPNLTETQKAAAIAELEARR